MHRKPNPQHEITLPKYGWDIHNLAYSKKMLVNNDDHFLVVDIERREYKSLGMGPRYSSNRKKLELPDGRILSESPPHTSRTFDPVTGDSTQNDNNLGLDGFNHNIAVNSEGVIAVGEGGYRSRAIVRFYRDDLMNPFQKLDLTFRYISITAVNDKFVMSAVTGTQFWSEDKSVTVFQKDSKTGLFKESYKLKNLPTPQNKKHVATVGPNKDVLLVADWLGDDRCISLWRENKKGEFDKPFATQKIETFGHYWWCSTWNNGMNFALQTGSKEFIHSDLQLSKFTKKVETQQDIKALIGNHAIHVVDDKIHTTTIAIPDEILQPLILAATPKKFCLPLIKIILGYYASAECVALGPLTQVSFFRDEKRTRKHQQAAAITAPVADRRPG